MPHAPHKSALKVVSPTATAPSPAAAIPRRITRSQVADLLGVSISTVRRLERDRLHPERGPDGANYFDPAEVTALATALATEGRPSKPTSPAPVPKLSAGEVAARAFECFEQRHSLAEVVIALRIEPKFVRELFHEWQLGLTEGELRRTTVALPPEESTRKVSEQELVGLLAGLPKGEPTRLSVARFVGEYEVDGESHLELREVGGFVCLGPLQIGDLTARFGFVPVRVSAYSLQSRAMHWEVLLSVPPARERG